MGKRNKRDRIKQNIFLIGPMGAGKTTIGVQLAKSLNREFYDSDKIVEERTGATIPLIFELEGEEGFRKREVQSIDELTQLPDVVVATGGGAVLKEENRQHLKDRGVVIYLKADLEQLLSRTSKDRNRPLLNTSDPRKMMEGLLAARAPLYESCADLIVQTGGQTVRDIINHILEQLSTLNKDDKSHPLAASSQ